MASSTTAARQPLAIHGGEKAKRTPYGSGGKRFAGNELAYLKEALDANTLFYAFGQQVKQACALMRTYTGMPHVVACSSGSAAIHLALVACGVGPGDEVITTPNTDSGTVLGVMEEGAVPVFADPEYTMQPSAAAIEAVITPRTRAVIVVHLAGLPAPMPEIVALCRSRGIGIIEDCAQSWGTRLNGQLVGSFGDAGCYSTNDYKHITTGDGGFVVLRDPTAFRYVSNYADKFYDRADGGALKQAHLGLNYRMTELQGAVARAQLERVDEITAHYHALGERLMEGLASLKGAAMVRPIPGGYGTYWWALLLIDPDMLTATRNEVFAALKAEGVAASSFERYDLITRDLFQKRIVRPWLTDERKYYPLVQPDGRSYTYSLAQTPRHASMIDRGIMLQIGGSMTLTDMDEAVAGIHKVITWFAR